jgi:hypothetical protein
LRKDVLLVKKNFSDDISKIVISEEEYNCTADALLVLLVAADITRRTGARYIDRSRFKMDSSEVPAANANLQYCIGDLGRPNKCPVATKIS